jgi:hypothetical protein
MIKSCLNCGAEINSKFCPECGQKSSTHRITFRKFIEHDLIHGVFHVDRGILYSLKGLLWRPGFLARNYIAGQRVKQYNIFTLFIIVVAVKVFVDDRIGHDVVFRSVDQSEFAASANRLFDYYFKVIFLLTIPVVSLLTYIFYRKLGYYYIEHIVLNCYLITGGLLYSLFFSLLGWLTNEPLIPFWGYLVFTVYYAIGLFQLARSKYTSSQITWRVVSILILIGLLLVVSLRLVTLTFFGGQFSGTITFESFLN